MSRGGPALRSAGAGFSPSGGPTRGARGCGDSELSGPSALSQALPQPGNDSAPSTGSLAQSTLELNVPGLEPQPSWTGQTKCFLPCCGLPWEDEEFEDISHNYYDRFYRWGGNSERVNTSPASTSDKPGIWSSQMNQPSSLNLSLPFCQMGTPPYLSSRTARIRGLVPGK